MTTQNPHQTTARTAAEQLARHPHAADGSDHVTLAEIAAINSERAAKPDYRPTPSDEDMRAIQVLAYKEHARRAAYEGWTLVSQKRNRPDARISTDLEVDQPVLIHGSTVAWATGVEVGDQYEVRLGTAYGPTLYVRSVVPCTEGTLQIRRARALARELRMSLDAARDHTFHIKTQTALGVLRGRVALIEAQIDRL